MSDTADGSRGIEAALLRELKLKNALVSAFLARPGDEVFPLLAEIIAGEFSPSGGVVAWAESWGRYEIALAGSSGRAFVLADAWTRLPGERGWTDAVAEIDSIDFPDSPARRVYAVPIREKGAVAGFIGLSPTPGASAPRGGDLELLSSAVLPLQVFAVERIHEKRLESMRKMTWEALAKSERRFQDFIEGSSDMIYITDARGVLVLVNKAGEELLGLPRSEILGRSFASFCPFAVDRDFFMERLTANGFVRDFESTLQRPDSTTVFVTESATAVKNSSGEIVEVQGIVHDITERLRNQRELWKANLELAETNDALKRTQLALVQQEKLASIGQLAAGIAHEINNPLGFLISDFRALKTAATSLADRFGHPGERGERTADEVPAEELEAIIEDLPVIVSEMDEGFGRIADIVRNLLTFARSGEIEGRARYDVNEGVTRALAIARNEIKYVADVELALGDPPVIVANAGEINQVFLNVFVNAAQAVAGQKRADRGRIAVSTGTGGGSVWIEIADDGPGIAEAAGRRIFEPFFTTKGPGKGTGLGLSISHDIIVRKHGGSLTFRPNEPRGTVFRLELPISRPEEASRDERY